MNVVSRECNHTSVSGDMTEERESEHEWINERDYISMSEYSNEWLVRIVLYIRNIYINKTYWLHHFRKTMGTFFMGFMF